MSRPGFHELKTWPEPFSATWEGVKLFEHRRDDRGYGYKVNDVLHLREWDPTREVYSGREVFAVVNYVARGGLVAPGYVILGIEIASKHPEEP